MKKILLTILFSVGFASVFACDCIVQKLVDAVANSEFIATAKIIKVVPDRSRPEYKNVTIELINLYKGEKLTTLRINTEDESSCAFLLPLHSTWLFFAGKNADGTIGFAACSKSEQIDIEYPDSLRYPTAGRNHRRSIELKLNVLSYLRDAKLIPINAYQLRPGIQPGTYSKFKGADIAEKEFAIYRITVDTTLTIRKIKPLKDWKDLKLKTEFLAYLESNLKIYKWEKGTQIPNPTELTIIFYAYSAEDGYESFISENDL
ncbi:MAG: hypothetical protein V4539_18995 [Bacteroidota bacterium]